MDSYDTGRLIYLLLLGLVLVGWFFSQGRTSWNKTLQQAAAWVLIFIGAIAAYGLWGDVSQTVRPQQTVFEDTGQIKVPLAQDGHYHIEAQVNGTPVRFVLDTGATFIVLTKADAARAGLDLDGLIYTGRAMTANGEVRTAPVELDSMSIGPIADSNVRAVVNDGEMETSLMGMSYLQKWGRIEIANNTLTLTR